MAAIDHNEIRHLASPSFLNALVSATQLHDFSPCVEIRQAGLKTERNNETRCYSDFFILPVFPHRPSIATTSLPSQIGRSIETIRNPPWRACPDRKRFLRFPLNIAAGAKASQRGNR
jgi:hypothetical protein